MAAAVVDLNKIIPVHLNMTMKMMKQKNFVGDNITKIPTTIIITVNSNVKKIMHQWKNLFNKEWVQKTMTMTMTMIIIIMCCYLYGRTRSQNKKNHYDEDSRNCRYLPKLIQLQIIGMVLVEITTTVIIILSLLLPPSSPKYR